MNELIINYSDSKSKKLTSIIIGAYFTVFCMYFLILEWLAHRYAMLFFFSLIGALFGIAIIVRYTLLASRPVIKIDNTGIYPNLPVEKNQIPIEWAAVTEMNIGVSYLVFILNGQKQQRIDLSYLLYKDMKEVKSKVMEICEFKNIPYKND